MNADLALPLALTVLLFLYTALRFSRLTRQLDKHAQACRGQHWCVRRDLAVLDERTKNFCSCRLAQLSQPNPDSN